MLSATLPDINTELPSLAQSFVARNGGQASGAKVEMLSSLRLPVGCDALDPNGLLVLPHQVAIDFAEFKLIVGKMHSDALMQRFYTPATVKQIGVAAVETVFNRLYLCSVCLKRLISK